MRPLTIKSATLRPFVVNLKSIPMDKEQKPVEIDRSLGNDPYWHHLCCPCCGETHLHHCAVRVFNRDNDDETGVETFVFKEESHTRVSPCCDNPSLRRHGVVIDFYCEHCSCGDPDHRVCLLYTSDAADE